MKKYFKDFELTSKPLINGKLYAGDLATKDHASLIFSLKGENIYKLGVRG